MVRLGTRAIWLLSLMTLLSFYSSGVLGGEQCTSVLILIDETSAGGYPGYPGYQEPRAVRDNAILLLNALAGEAQEKGSDFCVQLIKFSTDTLQIYLLPPEPLSIRQGRDLLEQEVHRNVIREDPKQYVEKQRVKAALCAALGKFKQVPSQSKIVFLVSDVDGALRTADTVLDLLTESVLGWLGCSSWAFTTVLTQFKRMGIPIHAVFVPTPDKPGAPWLAEIARLTDGRFISKTECVSRAFLHLPNLVQEVAGRVSFGVSKDEEVVAHQRSITLEILPQYDGIPIDRSETRAIECEEVSIVVEKVSVFLDGKHAGEAKWDSRRKLFLFSLEVPCAGDHIVSVRPRGKVRRWDIEVDIPVEEIPDLVFREREAIVTLEWTKQGDSFAAKLDHQATCAPQEGGFRIEIHYDPNHFDLRDDDGKPIAESSIAFPPDQHKIRFYPKTTLAPGTHRGEIVLEPSVGGLTVILPDGSRAPPFQYEVTILKLDRGKLIFPNLCFPSSEMEDDSFTTVLHSIRIDGLPEHWEWNRLTVTREGLPPAIPPPQLLPRERGLFDLVLTVPSCSALQPVKLDMNQKDIDGYLGFQYMDPIVNRLAKFTPTKIPIDLEYRERWARILQASDIVIRGVAHKGDKRGFSFEFSPDLYPAERCIGIDFKPDQAGDATPFEVLDQEGKPSPSRSVCFETGEPQFSVRVRLDSLPGHKSGVVEVYPSKEAIWLYCSSSRSEQLQKACLYRYDIEIPYLVEILDEKLICDIGLAGADQTSSCAISLDLGQGADAPSSGRLRIQITMDRLSRQPNEAYLDPPFAGNREVIISFEDITTDVPRNVQVEAGVGMRKLMASRTLSVKMTQRPTPLPGIKLLDLSFGPAPSPSLQGSEETSKLRGSATVAYDPEESIGPIVELNGSTAPVRIPIEAIIPQIAARIRIECDTLGDSLYFIPSQTSQIAQCGELIRISAGDTVSVYAKDDTRRGVHLVNLTLNPVESNLNLVGNTAMALELRVRHPVVAGLECQLRWAALAFFVLPIIALLITWIFYRNSGYDSFLEYIDELRWKWGKWTYIAPLISLGLAFLASVVWLLAAFVLL